MERGGVDSIELVRVQDAIDALHTSILSFHASDFNHRLLTQAFHERFQGLPALASRAGSSQESVQYIDLDAIADEERNSPLLHALMADNILAEILHYKSLFTHLKFNFIELDTKEKFLRSILREQGPIFAFADDNINLETSVMHQKRELKEAKKTYMRLAEETIALADVVQEAYRDTKVVIDDASTTLNALRLLKEECKSFIAQEQQYKMPTYADQHERLDDIYARKSALSAETATYDQQIYEFQQKVDALTTETDQMEQHYKQVYDQAEQLQTQWHQKRSVNVQLAAQWLMELTTLLGTLTCVREVVSLPNHIFRFSLDITAVTDGVITQPNISSTTLITTTEENLVDLIVRVNSVNQHVLDARLDGFESEPISFAYCPLDLVTSTHDDNNRDNWTRIIGLVEAATLRCHELTLLATRFPVMVIPPESVHQPQQQSIGALTIEIRLPLLTSNAVVGKPRLIIQLYPMYPLHRHTNGGIRDGMIVYVPSELSEKQVLEVTKGLREGNVMNKTVSELIAWIIDIAQEVKDL